MDHNLIHARARAARSAREGRALPAPKCERKTMSGILTEQEFNDARPRLGRLSLDTLTIARAVLVEGKTQTDVARENNLSRQRVHGMVSRVQVAINNIPMGWVRLEIWLPPELADKVKDMAEKAKAKAVKERASA